MNTFLTSFTEQEFKELLISAIREVMSETQNTLLPAHSETLNIAEAADFLKLKVNTLYEKTSRKLIPHFKKGNKLYFNRTELEEWIKKGKVKTHAELESEATMYVLNGSRKGPQRNAA